VAVRGAEAAAIEKIGLREFAADTDTPYTRVSSEDKAIYGEFLAQ
jgi:hypothetical protein